MPLRALRLLNLVEVTTLAVMLANLAFFHVEQIGSTLGPIHGLSYLGAFICTLLIEGAPTSSRLLSLVPAVGGYLALWRLQRTPPGHHRPSEVERSEPGTGPRAAASPVRQSASRTAGTRVEVMGGSRRARPPGRRAAG